MAMYITVECTNMVVKSSLHIGQEVSPVTKIRMMKYPVTIQVDGDELKRAISMLPKRDVVRPVMTFINDEARYVLLNWF